MKKIYKENKNLILSFFSFALLGILLGLLKVKNIPFVLLSVSLNLFFITMIKVAMKILKIEFNKKEKKVIATTIVGVLIFYIISIIFRKFIYYWDFSCYYGIQTSVEEAFNTNIFSGIRHLVGSTWAGEYGSFLCFFPECLFNFTSKSPNAYVLCSSLVFIPYITVTISILIKKIISLFKINDNKKYIFISALIAFITIPIVHSTFILGQPDIFGLAFIFLIIALTIDYDFSKVDFNRLLLIGILAFFLIIARRWYMYFVLVYFLCYGISIIVLNFKDKEKLKKILKNASIYILIVAGFLLVTLLPLFKKILTEGYSYDYYLNGGFLGELSSQLGHLGYFILIIIVIGLIYGLINKKFRLFSILAFIEYFLIIFIFTKTQNMGLHHSLLLVYIYLYFIFMFILLVKDKKILLLFTILLLFVNFGFGMFKQDSKVFTDVTLAVPYQENYDDIKNVSEWLKDNLGDDKAYMIMHNDKYNPDKFRNIFLPDTFIKDRLAYGSAIKGVHEFPTELFTSKYVITSTPFDNVSIEYIYNNVFQELIGNNTFSLVKEFYMKDGYVFYVYERVKEVNTEEINMYKEALKDLSSEYPDLYIKVIEEYEKENF